MRLIGHERFVLIGKDAARADGVGIHNGQVVGSR